ncbi:MAG: septum site-determining protein MinC [Bacillota bacterium]
METTGRTTRAYHQTIVIKGSRTGLRIILPVGADFSRVRQQIKDKLAEAKSFFKGAKVVIEHPGLPFSRGEEQELVKILASHEIKLVEFLYPGRHEEPPVLSVESQLLGEQAVVIKKTIRSGQNFDSPGHLVVLGDVNPGAEVTACGDIIVFGRLSGMAHAGKNGDTKAVIAALAFQPTQIRIAELITRPAENKNLPFPEIARINDKEILVEKYDLWNINCRSNKTNSHNRK